MNTKICYGCKQELPVSSFSKMNLKRPDCYNTRCKECRGAMRRELSRKTKAEAIQYKGGKCNDCLQVVHQAAFEFHHIDPSNKADKEPTHFFNDQRSLTDKAKSELDKCVLLCANCHRVRHFNF